MAVKTTLTLTRNLTGGAVSFVSGHSIRDDIQRLLNFISGAMGGAGDGASSISISENAVAGSLTITLASVAAGTVLLINGVPFTAKGSAATAGNNEFDISGGTDTLDAAALAAAINASTTTGIVGVVSATSLNAAVTLTASQAGRGSNAITVENLGVVATGTVTCAGVDAADAIAINGQAITAHATTAANNQFVVGATDAATATNLAAAINSSTTAIVSKHVRALARAAVVHLFAKYGGPAGNAITLTTTDGTDLAVSGARLTGGTLAQYEGATASTALAVVGADGGTYRTTINGVDIDVTGTNGDDAATMTDICAAINGSTDALVNGFVWADDALDGTAQLRALRGGHQGNAITSAVTGTGYTVGGARLSGGTVPTVAVIAGGTQTPVGGGANMTGGSSDTAVSYSFGTTVP